MELVAGRCPSHNQAQKYNNRWVIWMGPRTCKCTGHNGKREKGAVSKPGLMRPRTCKCTGHNGKREKGAVSKPGFYAAMYNQGGKQKAGVLEDTLMNEKEARERAGRLWEANRASAASAARALP
jgi:hypothetical protein